MCHVFVPLSLSFSPWHLLIPLPEHSSLQMAHPLISRTHCSITVSGSKASLAALFKMIHHGTLTPTQASCVPVTISNTIYFLLWFMASPLARCKLKKAEIFAWYLHSCSAWYMTGTQITSAESLDQHCSLCWENYILALNPIPYLCG